MMRGEGSGVIRGSRGHGPGVKKSKPAMEKRRRARINASLAELRSLIPDSVKRGNRRYSKMEKADILEMAVQYLRLLQDVNRDKTQVNTISYSLGFNECTQEVSQFFRSSSPTTSRFKGNLLDHLSDCAPNSSPDSPSSSPRKIARRSISGSFSASSIIARCLLSSTIITTPKKVSRNAGSSNTPAAVSSTSDDSSSERVLPAEEGRCENNLDNNSGMSSGDLCDPLQVKRSEICRVKKDLIRYFNEESRVCNPETSRRHSENPAATSSTVPSSSTVSCSSSVPSRSAVPSTSAVPSGNTIPYSNTVPNSSSIPYSNTIPAIIEMSSCNAVPSTSRPVPSSITSVKGNTRSRETFIQQTFNERSKTEETSTGTISHLDIPSETAEVINALPLLETDIPMLAKESLVNQEKIIASPLLGQAETFSSGKIDSKKNENFTSRSSCQLSPHYTDGNNNSQSVVNKSKIILSLPNSVPVTDIVDINKPDALTHCSDKISDNNLQSPNTNAIAKTTKNNNIYIKYNTLTLPASQSPSLGSADTTILLKKHLSVTRSPLEFESKPIPSKIFHDGPSVAVGISADHVSTTNIINGKSSTQSINMPSPAIPRYFQTSKTEDVASLQPALITNSSDTINISDPTLHTSCNTLHPTTKTGVAIVPSDIHKTLSKYNDNLINTDQHASANIILATVNGGVSIFLQEGKSSPNSLTLHDVNVSESDTDIHVQNKMNERSTNIQIETKAEANQHIPKAKLFSHQLKTLVFKDNTNETCTIANTLSSNSRSTDMTSPVFPVNKVTSPSLNQHQMKRYFHGVEHISEELLGHSNKVQDAESLTLIKRQRLTEANPHQSIFCKDEAPSTSSLSQYISTKFRPIAPKRDMYKGSSLDFHQQPVMQSVPITRNCFIADSMFDNRQGHNNNMRLQNRICSNHPSDTSPGSERQHHISSQSCNTKVCSNEESTNRLIRKDDILTTALKSNVPLDKTRFTASHVNVFNHNQAEFTAHPQISTNIKYRNHNQAEFTAHPQISTAIKHRNHNLTNHISSNDILMCQSNQQNKSLIHENIQDDTIFYNQTGIQEIVNGNRPQDMQTGKYQIPDSAGKHVAAFNRVTKSLDSGYTFHEEASFPTTTTKYISQSVQHNNINCSPETARACHQTSAGKIRYNQHKSGFSPPNSADFEIRPKKHRCLIFDLEDADKLEHDSLINSSELVFVAIPAHQKTKRHFWSSLNNMNAQDGNNDNEHVDTQTSNSHAIDSYPVSSSPLPLNLSLRDPNGQSIKHDNQNIQVVAGNYTQELEFKFGRCSNEATSALNYFPGDSQSTPVPHSFTTAQLCRQFPQQEKGMNLTINADVRNVVAKLQSVGSAVDKETNEVSMNANNKYSTVVTHTGCRLPSVACSNGDIARIQVFPEANSPVNAQSQIESGKYQDFLFCIPPPRISPISSSLTTNHESSQEISSFQSKSTTTLSGLSPSLRKVSNMNGQAEMIDDDMWRPW